MTDCQVCKGRAQLFLCPRCEQDLKTMLTDLAQRTATNHTTGQTRPTIGGIEALHDEAYGDTRKGESTRRSTEHSAPLPVNLNASHLFHTLQETLLRWVHTALAKGLG